jgi:hypothetical protein
MYLAIRFQTFLQKVQFTAEVVGGRLWVVGKTNPTPVYLPLPDAFVLLTAGGGRWVISQRPIFDRRQVTNLPYKRLLKKRTHR